MPKNKITHVGCAIRGRPESRETVSAAIDHALKHDAKLTFFYILDAEFLQHATIGPLRVVYQELRQMSEFTMLILMDRAQRKGVKNVDFIIKEGEVKREIRSFVEDFHVNLLVLGLPGIMQGRPYFSLNAFEQFVDELEEDYQIPIDVLGGQT